MGIGTVLAFALAMGAMFLSDPKKFGSLIWKIHVPVDLPLDTRDVAEGCAGNVEQLLVPISAWTRPLIEPLVERKIGSDRKTASLTYSGHWAERRCLSFHLFPSKVEVEARFDTDYGEFAGVIRTSESHARMDGDELCFDLAIERNDSSKSLERWQGKVAFR